MRYSAIYDKAAEQFGRDFSLRAVEARPSSLSNTRKIVDVILSFHERRTDFSEKCCVRVDVTEKFPFLVSKLTSYCERYSTEYEENTMLVPKFTAHVSLNEDAQLHYQVVNSSAPMRDGSNAVAPAIRLGIRCYACQSLPDGSVGYCCNWVYL